MVINRLSDSTKNCIRVLLTLIQSAPFIAVIFWLVIGFVFGVFAASWDSYQLVNDIEGMLSNDLFKDFVTHFGELTIGVAAFTGLTLQYSSVCEGREALRLKKSGKNSFIATCFLASAFLLNILKEGFETLQMLTTLAMSLAFFYFAVSFYQLVRVLFSRS